MAKKNKDFEQRMSGMLYAYKIAKTKGLEELEKDIKMRGVLQAPLGYAKGDMDRFLEYLIANFYTAVISVACIALEDAFGFKKTRLQRFKDAYEKASDDTMDLDYIGENYVTLEDYAVYLNDRFELDIDAEAMCVFQESRNTRNPNYHMVKVERLIEVMRQEGYEEAAEYLEWGAGIIDKPPERKKALAEPVQCREQQKVAKEQKGRTYDRRKENKKRA